MSICPVRTVVQYGLEVRAVPADLMSMNTIACSAVAQAGLSAATASLDVEVALSLLYVAGWLTTAADLMVEAGSGQTALALT